MEAQQIAKLLSERAEARVKKLYKDHDFVASFSSLTLYGNCPKMFEYRYKKRVKMKQNMRNAIIGIMAQRCVELWLSEDPQSHPREFVERAIKEGLKECTVTWKDPEDKGLLIADLHDHIDLMYKTFVDNGLEAPIYQMELKIGGEYEIGKIRMPVVGVIDQVNVYEDRIIIIDGKYFMKDKSPAGTQLLLYVYLLSRLLPELATYNAGFWLYRQGRVEWLEAQSEEVEGHLVQLAATYNQIRRAEFPAAPQRWYCSETICPAYGTCEARLGGDMFPRQETPEGEVKL